MIGKIAASAKKGRNVQWTCFPVKTSFKKQESLYGHCNTASPKLCVTLRCTSITGKTCGSLLSPSCRMVRSAYTAREVKTFLFGSIYMKTEGKSRFYVLSLARSLDFTPERFSVVEILRVSCVSELFNYLDVPKLAIRNTVTAIHGDMLNSFIMSVMMLLTSLIALRSWSC
ncbi:hypothetical protein TNCV_4507081 [Trichonephila clavipes]|nr:hypothetical protein TNCV_4507081 [Trichonephila clavipes]